VKKFSIAVVLATIWMSAGCSSREPAPGAAIAEVPSRNVVAGAAADDRHGGDYWQGIYAKHAKYYALMLCNAAHAQREQYPDCEMP
jgi:hypothetical protein